MQALTFSCLEAMSISITFSEVIMFFTFPRLLLNYFLIKPPTPRNCITISLYLIRERKEFSFDLEVYDTDVALICHDLLDVLKNLLFLVLCYRTVVGSSQSLWNTMNVIYFLLFMHQVTT